MGSKKKHHEHMRPSHLGICPRNPKRKFAGVPRRHAVRDTFDTKPQDTGHKRSVSKVNWAHCFTVTLLLLLYLFLALDRGRGLYLLTLSQLNW